MSDTQTAQQQEETEELKKTHPKKLTAPKLVKLLKILFAKDDRDRHWSVLSAALGRIEDERIYEKTEFGAHKSAEEWAKEKLELTRGEFRLALRLFRLMVAGDEAGIASEEWHALGKPKALLLDEVVKAGGDIKDWFIRAKAAKTAGDYEKEVRRHLGEELWITWTLRYPESLHELVKTAFQRAVPYALDSPDADVGTWLNADVVFRALEVIVKDYLDASTPMVPEQQALVPAVPEGEQEP